MQVSRQWLLCSAALLVAAFILLGSAARAQAKWYAYGAVTTECKYVEVRPGVFEDYGVVWANMFVSNEGAIPGNHYANHMRIKARLVPTEPGHNFFRHWNTESVETPLENTIYHRRMKGFSTDTVDPGKGWKLQVKFIWDRQVPFHDIVKKRTYKFETCEPPEGRSGGPEIGIPQT